MKKKLVEQKRPRGRVRKSTLVQTRSFRSPGRPRSAYYTEVRKNLEPLAEGRRRHVVLSPRRGKCIKSERMLIQKMIYQQSPHGILSSDVNVTITEDNKKIRVEKVQN